MLDSRIEDLEFNYIRMTWNCNVYVSGTWKNHVKINRLIRMICNYCRRIRSHPSYLIPDETYGIIIEMSQAYIYSMTASELMVTISSDEKTFFGKSFSEEIALEIKKRTIEYWDRKVY